MVDFSKLADSEIEAMAEAGATALDCFRVLAKSGDNIVGELLRDAGTFYEWDHYPKGDVYDSETHSQFYYHAHPADERPGEHGHFHTFIRPKGMPKDMKPAMLADYEPPEDPDDALSHIIGISMDPQGVPLRLFTTNRWVTGEIWYQAADVIRLIDLFEIDLAHPSWPVNRWVTAIVALYRPQIAEMLHARDAKLAEWEKAHPGESAYEDRDLEVASVMEIVVDDQLAAINKEIEKRG